MAASDKTKRAYDLIEQCVDTVEWQVGTGIPLADFLYPKLRQALGLLEVVEDGESESTTLDTYLERYPRPAVASTYDFTDDDESDN